MLIQNDRGQILNTTVDPTAIMLGDLQQGDVFSFMNDSSRRVFIMGADGVVIDINASNVEWNDSFIDASRARVVWYAEARMVLGQEYTEAGHGRGAGSENVE